MATPSALTEEDIHKLVKGETPDDRAIAAHKICRRIDRAVLTPQERAQADEILRLMSVDAAEMVRRALAVTLKASSHLPHDVAMRLAADVEAVAMPVLSYSPVFSDEDLKEIVRLGEPVRQIAVARRPELSEAVTEVIAACGASKAVEIACSNDNARFSEAALQTAIARFATDEGVVQAMAYRAVLPLSVTEQLVSLVSDQVRERLLSRHALSPETAMRLALGARERASIDLVDQAGRSADVAAFAAHLKKAERLTPSLLMRALAHGHLSFVEHAIAELSGVPHSRAWLMIHDAGPLGLRAIYERAGLPVRIYPAFRAGIDTYHALELEGAMADKEKFQERMLERFLTQPQPISREDMDYLIDKLDRVRRHMREAA